MRTIAFDTLVEAVHDLVCRATTELPSDVLERIEVMHAAEDSSPARDIMGQIIENAEIARTDKLPLCQDTGIAVFLIDIGDDCRVDGGGLEAAINEGVRRGYRECALRISIVADPFRRSNTGDNTPAVIHSRIVPGDRLDINFCPKGGGCENMSRLAMLTPGKGRQGVFDFVVETVRIGGGRPCPPLVVGVGVGGSFEYSAVLAKRSLTRTIGVRNADPFYCALEEELLQAINELGIGPMGLGGKTTALDVFIESAPCHIASLPVAVNIQCHSARHMALSL